MVPCLACNPESRVQSICGMSNSISYICFSKQSSRTRTGWLYGRRQKQKTLHTAYIAVWFSGIQPLGDRNRKSLENFTAIKYERGKFSLQLHFIKTLILTWKQISLASVAFAVLVFMPSYNANPFCLKAPLTLGSITCPNPDNEINLCHYKHVNPRLQNMRFIDN